MARGKKKTETEMETGTVGEKSGKWMPTVLSFSKSMEVFDVPVYGVRVYEHIQRPARSDKNAGTNGKTGSTNIVNGEMSKVTSPDGVVTATMEVRFYPLRKTPHGCNDIEKRGIFEDVLKTLPTEERLHKISRMMAYNILNGSWLWRNKEIAEEMRIEVKQRKRVFDADAGRMEIREETLIEVNAFEYEDHPIYPDPDAKGKYVSPAQEDKASILLGDMIAKAFMGELPRNGGKKGAPLSLYVKAKIYMGEGQSFYPSQLFLPTGTDEEGRRFFSTVRNGEEIPAITAEKAGNTIRRYDAWHRDPRAPDYVNSVEPRGGSLDLQIMLRERDGKKAQDIMYAYAIMTEEAMAKGESGDDVKRVAEILGVDEEEAENDLFYLLGFVVRGGLIEGDKKTNSKGKKNNKDEKKEKETEGEDEATGSLFEALGVEDESEVA